MGDMLKYQVKCRIGKNNTPGDRLGNPWTFYDLPVFVDGVQLGGNVETSEVETEHDAPGIKYGPNIAKRNAQIGQIRTPIFPEVAKFLLDMATSFTSGIPAYHMLQQYWSASLTGGAIGRRLGGLCTEGFSLNFDKTNPSGAMELQLDAYINRDTEIAAGVSKNVSNVSIANPAVITTSAAHDLYPGDTVTIASVGGATAVNGTRIVIEVPSTTTFKVDVNNTNAYTSGGTVIRVNPTPVFPALSPIPSSNALIDLKVGDATGAAPGAYDGNLRALRSLSIAYKNDLEITDFEGSTDPSLNQTWTNVYPGIPNATLSMVLKIDNDDYLDYLRATVLRKFKARIACFAPDAVATTSITNITAGVTTSITVASGTGLATGDVMLFNQPTLNKFQVIPVSNVSGTTLTVAAADVVVSMNGGTETIQVRNMAFQIEVILGRIKNVSNPTVQGNVRVVTVEGVAVVDAAQTSILSVLAYNET